MALGWETTDGQQEQCRSGHILDTSVPCLSVVKSYVWKQSCEWHGKRKLQRKEEPTEGIKAG